ncbi:MAG: deoxyribonuclease IV [Tissierellia bacterium]|nr:deoxyribonuclease IV [Tissierellia bacterium]
MFYIGPHLSVAKGYLNMGKEALKIDANTFQFFSRNPRGGRARKFDPEDFNALENLMKEHNFHPPLVHAPYTINPASEVEKTRNFALLAMKEDLERLNLMEGFMYNFHPGSHVGIGVERAIENIVSALDEVMVVNLNIPILLETMAGKGTEIGRNFEEIAQIIEKAKFNETIGVCLDTCHVFEAGYDIVNDLDEMINEFDRLIGIDRLKAIHLNDSKNELGAAKDRHEKIGKGSLGLEAIKRIINHPKLKDIPFYLETPNELKGYGEEIKLLRGMRE